MLGKIGAISQQDSFLRNLQRMEKIDGLQAVEQATPNPNPLTRGVTYSKAQLLSEFNLGIGTNLNTTA